MKVALGYLLGLCWPETVRVALVAAGAGNLLESYLGATIERRGLARKGIVNFVGGLALGLLVTLHLVKGALPSSIDFQLTAGLPDFCLPTVGEAFNGAADLEPSNCDNCQGCRRREAKGTARTGASLQRQGTG